MKRLRSTKSDIAFIVFLVIFFACIIGCIAINVYLTFHVNGYWLMGNRHGLSFFEIRYIWKKAPEIRKYWITFSIGTVGSLIGMIFSRMF